MKQQKKVQRKRRSVMATVKDAMASQDLSLEEIVMVTSFLFLLKTGVKG